MEAESVQSRNMDAADLSPVEAMNSAATQTPSPLKCPYLQRDRNLTAAEVRPSG